MDSKTHRSVTDECRRRWGRVTPYRLGLVIGERGLDTANPYTHTHGRGAFDAGLHRGAETLRLEEARKREEARKSREALLSMTEHELERIATDILDPRRDFAHQILQDWYADDVSRRTPAGGIA